MINIKKRQLVSALRLHAQSGDTIMKGQKTIADFLAFYFESLDIPADEKFEFWDIDRYIPQLILGAFDELLMSDDETIVGFRNRYIAETGHAVVSLTNIEGNGLDQSLLVETLKDIFLKVGDQWVVNDIDTVFNAERHILRLAFYRFLNSVFSKGLFEVIDSSKKRGMSGKFGETNLRSFVAAGRMMLTFSRQYGADEHSISYVLPDDDPHGLGAGVQSLYTDLRVAIEMIDDVIENWPSEEKHQKKAFKADKNVSIL